MFFKQKKNKGHNEDNAYTCHLFSAPELPTVAALCLAAVLLIVLLVALASQIKAQPAIHDSPCHIYFPESLGSPITVLSRGRSYEFTLMEMSYNAGEYHLDSPQLMTVVPGDEKILYPEAFDTIDVEYVLESCGIKEFFIVHEKPRAPADYLMNPTLDFGELIYAEGLTMYIDGLPAPENFTTDRSIAFVDEARGETIFILASPYALDADGNIIQIHYTVHTEDNEVLVYTQTPYSWLNDPERAYPVKIDPSVTISAEYSIVVVGGIVGWEDNYISSGNWHGDTYRTGIDFDTTVIPDTAIITKVELRLTIDEEGGIPPNNDVGKMTSTANTYYTGNNKPGLHADADGNEYLSNSNGFNGLGTHTVELLPAAATDLQNQLGDNWFSVGFTGTTETGDNHRDGKRWDEMPNEPKIIVTYFYESEMDNQPTAVKLISFTAIGRQDSTLLEWKTAHEMNNMGFYLYRGETPYGPFLKLTNTLIPGLNFSFKGKTYSYEDEDIRRGKLYYYRLDDIDIEGMQTQHGPICVDWDGANLPDDQESFHGLALASNHSEPDMDTTMLSIMAEYAGSANLLTPNANDSNIPDGEEERLLRGTITKTASPCIITRHLLSSSTTYKILLRDEGMYRLTGDEVEKYGIGIDEVDLSKVRLFNLGQEVAIHVSDEDGDNQLDSSDYIEFFGKSLPDRYRKYDKNNIYWLRVGAGIDAAKRMKTIEGSPKDGKIAELFRSSVHYEENEYYLESMPGEDQKDRWLFSPFALGREVDLPRAGDPVSFPFHTINSAGKGSLTISLYGTCNIEHEVEISLNNTPLGTFSFCGITSYQTHIKGVDLLEGTNILTITCNREIDSVGLDWFDVDYPKAFIANNNHVEFTHESGYRYHVSGFSENKIHLFDITKPGDVTRIGNFTVAGTGPYALDFEPHYTMYTAGKKRYCILTKERMKTPLCISEKHESGLKDKAVDVNYIIITRRILGWDENGTLYPWLHDLLTLRESQGLKPIIVDLEDIYDEFSYGIHTPQAIKDFLIYAHNNRKESYPQYVVLLGDSSYDYTNNWNLKEEDYAYVPTYLIVSPYKGESGSDEWFVRTDEGDPITHCYIGRLPAASTEQAEVMVKKILTYETTVNSKSWEKNVLLVADNINEAFETMNDEVAARIPPGMNIPFKSYLDDYLSPKDCAADIKTKINKGCLIVNYNGHGWGQIFAKEGIFKNDDIVSLTNNGKLPFFVSMTCMTGYFINPESLGFTCMAEALLRAEGKGAIAAFMSTGMTTPIEQQIINSALFHAIFAEDIRTCGHAIAHAKHLFLKKGEDFERLSETFLLFGDPAMTLKIPLPRRPSGIISQSQKGCITLTWQKTKDCHGDIVAGYNCYRSTKAFNNYTRINSSLITDTCYKDRSTEEGTIYYYVVTSIDTDGDESVPSGACTCKSL
ncbi:MAG: C25 family cysteine peptidase [bacterium]